MKRGRRGLEVERSHNVQAARVQILSILQKLLSLRMISQERSNEKEAAEVYPGRTEEMARL